MSNPTPYPPYPDNGQGPYGPSNSSWGNNDASPYADPTYPDSGNPSYPPPPSNTVYAQQSYYPPAGQEMYPPPPQPVYTPYAGYRATQTNGPGIASLVLGIIGVLMFWFPFIGLPVSIIGLALASAGMRRLDGKGFAVAGLVLSIIGLILTICVAAAAISSLLHRSTY